MKTTCTFVNWTNHATVFNLQPCELCKKARLSIKFAHHEWRIICKKKTFVRRPRQGASRCKHIQIGVVRDECMPDKNTAQCNNWQTEKHPESREKPVCFVTGHIFLVIMLKENGKQTKTKHDKSKKNTINVTSSSASNSILTSSPISWNGAQYIISENKQTVVNALTAVEALRALNPFNLITM